MSLSESHWCDSADRHRPARHLLGMWVHWGRQRGRRTRAVCNLPLASDRRAWRRSDAPRPRLVLGGTRSRVVLAMLDRPGGCQGWRRPLSRVPRPTRGHL